MIENSRVRGLYTLVKWIDNTATSSPNRLVTRTLGKYGFVSSDYDGPSPRHDEFWLVRIDREIKANSLKGCFVITPVKHIDRSDIGLLVPGLGQYKEFYEDGIRYILPADKDKYYIFPLTHRKSIKDVRSVIVVNFMLAKYRNDERYFHFPAESGYEEEQDLYKSPTSQVASSAHPVEPMEREARSGSVHGYSQTVFAQRTPYDGNPQD